MGTEIAFTTIHGSRLYGLNHAGSDEDFMIVYTYARPAFHHKSGNDDVIHVGLPNLIEYAHTGAHQFVEGLFSQHKTWYDDSWKPFIESYQIPPGQVAEKYERTIKRLCFAESFKLRRHAARLWCNLFELRMSQVGRFNPTLDPATVHYITGLASNYREEELKEILLS